MATKLIELGERKTISLIRKYAVTADPKGYQDAFFCKFPRKSSHLVYNLDDLRGDLPRENIYGVNKHRVAGRFLAAHTMSDLICTGVKPIGFSAVFTFDDKFTDTELRDFLKGINDVLSAYGGVRYEMGDTNFSTKSSFVGFAWGAANKGELIPRGGGKAGNLIVTTGRIGAGFAGYLLKDKIHELSKESFGKVKEIETNPISHLEPILKCNTIFGGGMDLTDGLSDFITNQVSISGCGVKINFSENIISPVALEASKILGIRPINFFFEGGYDSPRIHAYTLREEDFDKASKIFKESGAELIIIGELKRKKNITIFDDGKEVVMKLLRNEHKSLDEQFISDWEKAIV